MGDNFSSLRTRIVAAIAKADQDWCSDNSLHEDMADAVIRELGLREERRGPVNAYRDGQYYPDSSIVRVISDWKSRND